MMKTHRPLLVLFVLFALAGVACQSPESRRRKLEREIGPPQPVIETHAVALDGSLQVTAQLAPLTPPLRPAGGGEPPPGMGGPPPSGGMRPPEGGPARLMIAPPRTVLTLTLANVSPRPLELWPIEVDAAIGRFAPRPERVRLAPGESYALDGMTSVFAANFGMTSVFAANFDELTVRFTLRAGPPGATDTTLVLNLTRSPAGVALPPTHP
jgi:hypothetical protein